MPTYEYRCNGCKREFEVQQKMADPDLVHCDECGEDKLEKLISWTSVRSDTWQSALSSGNPKEAMKGLHAVDRSRPPKKEPPAATTPSPAATTPAPTTTTPAPATTTPAPAPATTTPPPAVTTSATADDATLSDDDDDEQSQK